MLMLTDKDFHDALPVEPAAVGAGFDPAEDRFPWTGKNVLFHDHQGVLRQGKVDDWDVTLGDDIELVIRTPDQHTHFQLAKDCREGFTHLVIHDAVPLPEALAA